jgi:hypothetical protein
MVYSLIFQQRVVALAMNRLLKQFQDLSRHSFNPPTMKKMSSICHMKTDKLPMNISLDVQLTILSEV